LVSLLFLFGSGLGCLIVVLCAARWVMKAYQSGPALIGRQEALEAELEQLRGEVRAGIAEAKAEATKRYRRDRQKVARAEKAGTTEQLDPELQSLVAAPMMQGAPPPNGSTVSATPGQFDKTALRRMARERGFGS
jgi:hypothetical protein